MEANNQGTLGCAAIDKGTLHIKLWKRHWRGAINLSQQLRKKWENMLRYCGVTWNGRRPNFRVVAQHEWVKFRPQLVIHRWRSHVTLSAESPRLWYVWYLHLRSDSVFVSIYTMSDAPVVNPSTRAEHMKAQRSNLQTDEQSFFRVYKPSNASTVRPRKFVYPSRSVYKGGMQNTLLFA